MSMVAVPATAGCGAVGQDLAATNQRVFEDMLLVILKQHLQAAELALALLLPLLLPDPCWLGRSTRLLTSCSLAGAMPFVVRASHLRPRLSLTRR